MNEPDGASFTLAIMIVLVLFGGIYAMFELYDWLKKLLSQGPFEDCDDEDDED